VPNGTFAAPVSVPTGGLTRNVIAGDWNGDGIPDLAVSGIGVRLLYGNGTGGRGNGTFTQGPNVATGPVPHHMATGDFDMDGVTDLAVCNTSTNTVSVLLGNGTAGAPDGTFAAAINASSGSGPNTWRSRTSTTTAVPTWSWPPTPHAGYLRDARPGRRHVRDRSALHHGRQRHVVDRGE
jgi:hypothetical protein